MNDIIEIIILSLIINLTATTIAFIIGTGFGYLLYFYDFKLKKLVIIINKTLMGIPPVVLGLLLFLLLKRDGALGFLQLLYTPFALLIAQILLIVPIITGNVYQMLEQRGNKLFYTLKMYEVKSFGLIKYSISEFRNQLLFIFMIGFARAVSEVGAVIIVGGNILGSTRMMTTAIVTLRSSGNFSEAIILGIMLLLIAFLIQAVFESLQRKNDYENI